MAQVVFTNTSGTGTTNGSLFNGTKFWLSARVPLKKQFTEEIKANGGQIVQLEKQADMIIVDPRRKDIPANSFSYKFIDLSIRNGALEDPEDHRAAPETLPPRPAGSVTQSAKSIRVPFTLADDRFLLDWMENYDGPDAGNKVYQQLGQANTRHPWQAWRDRYVKRYRGQQTANVQVRINPPPTPPAERTDTDRANSNETRQRRASQVISPRRKGRPLGHDGDTPTVRTNGYTAREILGGDCIKALYNLRHSQPSQQIKSHGEGHLSVQVRPVKSRTRTSDQTSNPGPSQLTEPLGNTPVPKKAHQTENRLATLNQIQYSNSSQPVSIRENRRALSTARTMEPSIRELDKTQQPKPSQKVPETNDDEDPENQSQEASVSSEETKKLNVTHNLWLDIVERSKFDLPNEKAIANLCSTYDSVLETDEFYIAEAWETFSEHYPGRSAEEWEAFWKDELQLFYRRHLAEFKRRFATTYTSPSPEPTSPPPRTMTKSPEFQPESPELPTAREAVGRVPFAEMLGAPKSPLKRVQIDVDEEWNAIPDSLPSMSVARISPKRRRIQTPPEEKAVGDEEIPSTSEEASTVDEHSISYPALPPDSDEEKQDSGSRMKAFNHYDYSVDSDDNDEFEEGKHDPHIKEQHPILPAERLGRSKLDTQGEVDAQLLADIELRTSEVSRASDSEEEESSDDGSTIYVEPKPGLAERSVAHPHDQEVDMTEGEEDGEESDEETPLEPRGLSPEIGQEEEVSDQEPTPKPRGHSPEIPEIPETQTQRRPTQPNRTFRPAAFRTEDSPPLFVRSPTSPPPSSPPQLTSSPRDDQSDDARTIPATSTSAASSRALPTVPELDNTARELDDWFDTRIAHGFSALRIQRALMSTSGDPDLADKALEQMQTKDRDTVPGTMEGVWTEADDECLVESDNPKMLGVVMTKHGSESVDRRYRFLRETRGEGSDA